MVLAGQTNTTGDEAKAGRPVVLQVLPALVAGGVERGTIDIAAALAAAGGTAVVASEGGPLERELARAGVAHVTLPLSAKGPLAIRRNARALEQVIAHYGVEIVHARSRAPARSARIAARRRGCRFVTTFHGAYGHSSFIKRVYNGVMTKGEPVIAPSAFIERHLREVYKLNPARIRLIERGVDLDIFSASRVTAPRVIQLATKWRVPEDVPLVMLPGRLTRWKGQALLIEALTRLRDLNFCCVIIGDDQGRSGYRRELEKQIERLDLRSRAFVLDHCNDMPAAYMLADVVVSASTEPEAFGRVISEAQAMGRPVVASDHGGAREQVLPDVTAYLFEPGSPDALAAALRRALRLRPNEREHLSGQAEMHVRARFSKERMCRHTLQLYGELIQG